MVSDRVIDECLDTDLQDQSNNHHVEDNHRPGGPRYADGPVGHWRCPRFTQYVG
jgi:hypothetical protein